MQTQIASVTRKVLEEITPTDAYRQKIQHLSADLERKVVDACKEFGVAAVVRVEGSVAKDTWLRGDPDVDVFMRLPTSIPRRDLGEISLKIAKKATEGSEQIERFAEHPYLEAFVDGVRVNVVPCYDSPPGEWLSATDRTPYHTNYVNSHLRAEQRGEVRLLKKFMKGIGVYGAEIKVGGFSGYLCELLTLTYGSFAAVLQAFAQHVPRRTVDLEGYYASRQRELELLFPEPLVIVDPVDKGRNVASAVQPQRLHEFAAASRAFLQTPRKEFFKPPKTTPFLVEALKAKLQNRGPALLFLTFDRVEAVPDVLWGQLHRTRKALHKQLELSDFKVLRDAVWSDDCASFGVFVFELEQLTLPNVKRHLGPPLQWEKECEAFLAKYTANGDVVAGPYVADGRWVVEVHRKFTDATELMKAKLSTGGKEAGVAGLIVKAFKQNHRLLVDAEVAEIYEIDKAFAVFLTEFFSGKPFWLSLETAK